MTSNGHQSGKPLRAGDPSELNGYRIESRLGRGGMGTVYLAKDERDRPLAIKLIHPDLADDEDFRLRFAREVESAQRVARFSTAGVIDAKLEGEPLYIVSEYVSGPTLDDAVRSGGEMAGGTLDSLAMGVAAALTAIHGSGVIHRDLKPANVLLSPVGPKVIDFGIARALDDARGGVTRSSQLMGTPSYMAPELILGEQATAAADIFAWGCLVAFAGTGTAPFDAATVPAVLHNISSSPPRLEGLDPHLLELVRSTLDKQPENRPTSQQLLATLTGQEQPEEAEVNRTITTSWAPPSTAPVPGEPPQGQAPPPDVSTHQPGAPPTGDTPPPKPSPTAEQAAHQPPNQTQPAQNQPAQAQFQQGGPGFPSSGPQQGFQQGSGYPPPGHPQGPPPGYHYYPHGQPQGPAPGQQPYGHHPSGGQAPVPAAHPMHPGHQSPAQGQQGFGTYSGPGGPGQPPGGPAEGAPDPGKRRRKGLVIAAAAGALLVIAAVGLTVVLTSSPGPPEDTVSIFSTDFASGGEITSSTYQYGISSDGYWGEQQGVFMITEPDFQESRGEYLELEEDVPDHVLVSATAYANQGPGQAMHGVRCWDNDGDDERTMYEGLLRFDGEQAEIRRVSEESGDRALESVSEVSGYETYPRYDEDVDDDPSDFDATDADLVTNTITMACEYDSEENVMELSLWVNDSLAVTAVDETPLPDDAEDPEDRRRTGLVSRAALGGDAASSVLFTEFSLHEILVE